MKFGAILPSVTHEVSVQRILSAGRQQLGVHDFKRGVWPGKTYVKPPAAHAGPTPETVDAPTAVTAVGDQLKQNGTSAVSAAT